MTLGDISIKGGTDVYIFASPSSRASRQPMRYEHLCRDEVFLSDFVCVRFQWCQLVNCKMFVEFITLVLIIFDQLMVDQIQLHI